MADIVRTFSELLSLLKDKANHAPQDTLEKRAKKKACKDSLNSAQGAADFLDISGWEVTIPKPEWVTALETDLAAARAEVTGLQQQVAALQQEVQRLRTLSPEQLIQQAVTDITARINQTSAQLDRRIRDTREEVTARIDRKVTPQLTALEGQFSQLPSDIIERIKTEVLPGITPPSLPVIKVNGSRCYTPVDADVKLRAAFLLGHTPTVLDIDAPDGVDVPPVSFGPCDTRQYSEAVIFALAMAGSGTPGLFPAIYLTAHLWWQAVNPAVQHGYHLLTVQSKTDSANGSRYLSTIFEKP